MLEKTIKVILSNCKWPEVAFHREISEIQVLNY